MRTPTIHTGFTLVETMAAITVLAVLGSIASFLLVPAVSGLNHAATEAQIHTELSMAMDRIERELRSVPLDADALPEIAPDVASMTSATMNWSEEWSLSLVNSEVWLDSGDGTPRRLLSDVHDFVLEAFDESDSAVTLPCSGAECHGVRRVRVTATVERSGITHMLRTKIFLRSTVQGGGV